MTVEETRRILGQEVENLTDQEIVTMIEQTQRLCDVILDNFIRYYKPSLQKS